VSKHEIMIVANYPHETLFSLNELCEVCTLSSEKLNEFIDYGIIHPKYSLQHEQVFNMQDLQRVKTALRLQHDLEINMAGIALVLDLLDQVDELRARADFFQRYF
jgi:chaperone modulatory protein CbpM